MQKKSQSLTILTLAALALPGVGSVSKSQAQTVIPGETWQFNHRYTHYQEGDNRMRADTNSTSFVIPLQDRLQFSGNFKHDTYAGATPEFSAPKNMLDVVAGASGGDFGVIISILTLPAVTEALIEGRARGIRGQELAIFGIDTVLQRAVPSGTKPVQSLAAHPRESRFYGTGTASYAFDNATLSLTGGQSTEPDYTSSFGFAGLTRDFNQKQTTLNVGYGYAADTISSAVNEDIGGDRTTHTAQFGFSQVTGKNSVFSSNVTYTRAEGFLSNAYKLVYIRGELTAADYLAFTTNVNDPIASRTNLKPAGIDVFFENRPGLREQWSVFNRLVQYVPFTDAAVHLDYRFYTDNWNIRSHLFEVNWLQPVKGWMVRPHFRYYSQSSADFFAPFFLQPRADGFYTSDFRLSSHGSISTGIQINKNFNQIVGVSSGFEYTFRRSNLKIGGNNSSSYADFDYYFANVALFLRF